MRLRRLSALALAAVAVLAGALSAAPAGAASSPEPGVAQASTLLRMPGVLTAVAVVSRGDVWAVGADGSGVNGLIAHWNGTRWSHIVVKGIALNGITAISAADVWAVGDGAILHWNGRAWATAKSPILFAAAAGLSAGNIWAGGFYPEQTYYVPALLHWTGRKWYVIAVQSPKGEPLEAVTGLAVSGPRSAWATADIDQDPVNVLLHWNGTTWKTAAYPGKGNSLISLAALATGPHGTAWAVGATQTTGTYYPYSIFWNGTAWRDVPVRVARNSTFSAACFAPDGTGWAIDGTGATGVSASASDPLIRWTGKTWTTAPITIPGPADTESAGPAACAARSAQDAWAVGSFYTSAGALYTLTMHWNGKTWS